MRRRVAAIACGTGGIAVGVLALAATTIPAATGCTTHQCDLSTLDVGGDAAIPEGGPVPIVTHLPDGEIKWETGPIDGRWLEFPGERTYVLHYDPVTFANPPVPTYLIAADFIDAEANFVVGAANLAQLSNASTTGVSLLNPACTEYGLYVSVQGFPAPDADAGPDAGDDAGLQDTPGLPDATE